MKPEHHKPAKHPLPPHRQRAIVRLLVLLVILLMAIIGFLLFKPALPSIPPPPGLRGGPPSPPGMQRMKTGGGIVTAFAANNHMDVNSVTIETRDAGLIAIAFRPHTARYVMNVAALKDEVEFEYGIHPDDESVGYQLHSIKNLKTGASVDLDQLPPPPRVPANQSPETFFIKDPKLVTDQFGGIAAIQSKQLLFHFKPEQVDDILSLIKSSSELSVLAVSRDSQSGFVNINHNKVYIVISITLGNKTFLIR